MLVFLTGLTNAEIWVVFSQSNHFVDSSPISGITMGADQLKLDITNYSSPKSVYCLKLESTCSLDHYSIDSSSTSDTIYRSRSHTILIILLFLRRFYCELRFFPIR